MKARAARPILLIDLAMPRDVDPAVAAVGNVFLYNLDDLAGIAEKNRLARMAEAERGRQALPPRVDSLWRHLQFSLMAAGAASPGQAPASEPAKARGLPAAVFA
jgi:glutamyl-tRNA reductase